MINVGDEYQAYVDSQVEVNGYSDDREGIL